MHLHLIANLEDLRRHRVAASYDVRIVFSNSLAPTLKAHTTTTVIAAIGRHAFSPTVMSCLLQIVMEYAELSDVQYIKLMPGCFGGIMGAFF
jgi:hypothetical protein